MFKEEVGGEIFYVQEVHNMVQVIHKEEKGQWGGTWFFRSNDRGKMNILTEEQVKSKIGGDFRFPRSKINFREETAPSEVRKVAEKFMVNRTVQRL